MIANQEIINAINEQIGNEFGAMLQYYAIAAHFDAEGLPDLSAHFYEQAEEERKHALCIIQFVIGTSARVNIPSVSAPRLLSTWRVKSRDGVSYRLLEPTD